MWYIRMKLDCFLVKEFYNIHVLLFFNGIPTLNTVLPGIESNEIVPLCFSTTLRQMSKPRPLPSPGGFVVKKD